MLQIEENFVSKPQNMNCFFNFVGNLYYQEIQKIVPQLSGTINKVAAFVLNMS